MHAGDRGERTANMKSTNMRPSACVRQRPSARVISGLFATVLAIAACGGGGGGPNTLTISNLRYSPTSAYYSAGGTTVILGSIDFNDTAGAVTILRFTSSAGADLSIPVTGAPGRTSGTLQGSFTVSTATLGNFTFEVWLVDATGLNSNHVTGSFSVSYDNTATRWTQRTSGLSAYLRGVAWTGTQYVVVGSAGTIATSPDGIAWTQRTSTTANDLYGITWSGSELVVVGTHGTILTSPDGASWTARSSTVADSLYSVIWAGSQFVATGGSSNISANAPLLTSPDGVTWTPQTSGLPGWNLSNIAWSGTRLCVVGDAQYQPAPNIVLASTDGATWTQETVVFPNNSQYLSAVVWANSKFIAVGPPNYVATSDDGLTWQAVASSNLFLLNAVTWSGSMFVAAGADINTSPDGVSWTRTASTTTNVWGVVWGQDKFVAVGDAGLIMTSP
jgi:hypothetical protein